MTPDLYLLDTNILVHLVRGDGVGQHLRDTYSLSFLEPRPLLCIVSEGELRSLVYQFRWGTRKAEQALFYLSYFKRVSIDQQDVYEAYAAIAARRAGYRIGGPPVWIDPDTIKVEEGSGDALAAESLCVLLLDPDPEFRVLAVQALEQLGDTRAVMALCAALQDEQQAVRITAARTLGRIKDIRGVAALCTALQDENWEVRVYTAQALGKIGDAQAVKPLKAALEDSEPSVCW